MAKKLTQPEQFMDPVFFGVLKQCLDHNLKREDFYLITKKKKEKRVDALTASKLLIERSFLNNIRICLHTKTSYMYYPKGICGPFNDNQVRFLLSQVVGKVGVKELTKPYFIDQILKALKCNTKIAVNSPVWLFNLNTKEI